MADESGLGGPVEGELDPAQAALGRESLALAASGPAIRGGCSSNPKISCRVIGHSYIRNRYPILAPEKVLPDISG